MALNSCTTASSDGALLLALAFSPRFLLPEALGFMLRFSLFCIEEEKNKSGFVSFPCAQIVPEKHSRITQVICFSNKTTTNQ